MSGSGIEIYSDDNETSIIDVPGDLQFGGSKRPTSPTTAPSSVHDSSVDMIPREPPGFERQNADDMSLFINEEKCNPEIAQKDIGVVATEMVNDAAELEARQKKRKRGSRRHHHHKKPKRSLSPLEEGEIIDNDDGDEFDDEMGRYDDEDIVDEEPHTRGDDVRQNRARVLEQLERKKAVMGADVILYDPKASLDELETLNDRLEYRYRSQQVASLLYTGIVAVCGTLEVLSKMYPLMKIDLTGFDDEIRKQRQEINIVLLEIYDQYGSHMKINPIVHLSLILFKSAYTTAMQNYAKHMARNMPKNLKTVRRPPSNGEIGTMEPPGEGVQKSAAKDKELEEMEQAVIKQLRKQEDEQKDPQAIAPPPQPLPKSKSKRSPVKASRVLTF